MTAVEDKPRRARQRQRFGIGPAYDRAAGALPGWAWGLIALGAMILYGVIGQGTLGEGFYDALIETLAYVMMALGLNIVVGFAGLLGLGYVAFYAIGAFVAGWFMSGQFGDVGGKKGIHFVVSDFTKNLPGIHINFIIVLIVAAAFTALWGADRKS